MAKLIENVWREIIRWADRLDTQEWLLVLLGVCLVGLYCMRGFGSRSEY